MTLLFQISTLYHCRKGAGVQERGSRVKVLWKKGSDVGAIEKVEERQIINLFCRLAEKRLLLNIPEAGLPEVVNCCHSGCDSCNYSRIFDELTSGRPKWIPFYKDLTFIDGRRHITKWNSIYPDSSHRIDVIEFSNALIQLPIQACLGPPISLSAEEDLDFDSVQIFWTKLRSANIQALPQNEDRMSFDEIILSLMKLTEKEYGCTYGEFKKVFQLS
eukprot:gene12977-14227_t